MTRVALASFVLATALVAGTPAWAKPPATNPAGKPTGGSNGHPAGPPVSHPGEQTDQGVVQSVNGSTVVVKALDGSTLSVPVGAQTRVLVDGKVGTIAGVQPGDVAVVQWKVGKTAQSFEAFDLSPGSGERLVTVKAVGASRVVVNGANAGSLTIHTNARTRIYLDGRPATLRSIASGDTLVLGAMPKHGKPAAELAFLSPS